MNTFAILNANRTPLESSGEGHHSVLPISSQVLTSPGSAPEVIIPEEMPEREIVSGST